MTEPDNIILEHLRAIRAQGERTNEKIDALAARMLAVEQHVLALHTDVHALQGQIATFGIRLERVERRLGLIEEPAR